MRVALCSFFFLAGFVLGLFTLFEFKVPVPPTFYADPLDVLYLDGRRCMVFQTSYRGALTYSVHCDDGSVHITTNYFYLSDQ